MDALASFRADAALAELARYGDVEVSEGRLPGQLTVTVRFPGSEEPLGQVSHPSVIAAAASARHIAEFSVRALAAEGLAAFETLCSGLAS